MTHITVENVVETETSDFQALITQTTDEALTELNSAQLTLIGGGTGVSLLY
jgi:hypothetical protein